MPGRADAVIAKILRSQHEDARRHSETGDLGERVARQLDGLHAVDDGAITPDKLILHRRAAGGADSSAHIAQTALNELPNAFFIAARRSTQLHHAQFSKRYPKDTPKQRKRTSTDSGRTFGTAKQVSAQRSNRGAIAP